MREPKYEHSKDGFQRVDELRDSSIQRISDMGRIRPSCWCYKFNADETHQCDKSSGLHVIRRPDSPILFHRAFSGVSPGARFFLYAWQSSANREWSCTRSLKGLQA